MNLQGLIFDIDGTLIDSNDIHTECWVAAFEHFGKHVEYDVMRGQIGKGGDLLVPDLMNAKEMQRFGEDLKDYRTKLFKKDYMSRIEPFPRVRELFEWLREREVRLALASSSNEDEVEYYTRLLAVGDLLEGSTSKHDAELSKPSPEIFRAALERIGTDAAYTMTVGDTPYDVLASHRCALPTVAVLCGGFERETLSKAEFIFDDIQDIPRKIDDIDAYFER